MDRVGHFNERISRGQDTETMVRIARISKIDFINEPLYVYRLHKTDSKSKNELQERTKKIIILFKKIIASEHGSRKDLARQFAFRRLAWHINRLRAKRYFEPIMVWFLYLNEFNFNLPLGKWLSVGLKGG